MNIDNMQYASTLAGNACSLAGELAIKTNIRTQREN